MSKTNDLFLYQVTETRRLWATVANEFDPTANTETADSSEHADQWALDRLADADAGEVVRRCWEHDRLAQSVAELSEALQKVAGRLEIVLRDRLGATLDQIATHPDLCAARVALAKARGR